MKALILLFVLAGCSDPIDHLDADAGVEMEPDHVMVRRVFAVGSPNHDKTLIYIGTCESLEFTFETSPVIVQQGPIVFGTEIMIGRTAPILAVRCRDDGLEWTVIDAGLLSIPLSGLR